MIKNKTENFLITFMAGIITFFLVIISPPMLIFIHLKRKRLEMKETLFQQCVKELAKRRIEFIAFFSQSGGGWIESPSFKSTYYYISFKSDDEVSHFVGLGNEVIINNMEELLKLKPFVENDK